MSKLMNRRVLLASGICGAVFMAVPAVAFSTAKAEMLINDVVSDINSIINSGKSESAMLRDFEGIFRKYADGARIGQLVLGPVSRTATASQRRQFAKAFETYISRKYGRRFREFVGGRIEVNSAKAVKSFYEVTTTAHLAGEAPFKVQFVVADKNGRFIDLKIEGISLIKAERTEIGSMLDKRKGNLDQLISDLKTTG